MDIREEENHTKGGSLKMDHTKDEALKKIVSEDGSDSGPKPQSLENSPLAAVGDRSCLRVEVERRSQASPPSSVHTSAAFARSHIRHCLSVNCNALILSFLTNLKVRFSLECCDCFDIIHKCVVTCVID